MKLHSLIRSGSIAFLTAFPALSEPVKKSSSYYKPPQSYSTTRDPDVPKYARSAQDMGIESLQDLSWLDLGLDY
ncbi:MAG: hypothetical protein CFE26_05025, partial [Verrucomicrobiales bacterium VVV1]